MSEGPVTLLIVVNCFLPNIACHLHSSEMNKATQPVGNTFYFLSVPFYYNVTRT